VGQDTRGLGFTDAAGNPVTNRKFDPGAGDLLAQPGTLGFFGATPCTFGDLLAPGQKGSETARLPGCRSPYNDVEAAGRPKAYRWKEKVDGDPRKATLSLPLADQNLVPITLFDNPGRHPFTNQLWENEMAIVSWNFQALLVANSSELTEDLARIDGRTDLTPAERTARKQKRAYSVNNGKCSFRQPQFCGTPEAVFAVSGVTRPTVDAGGSGRFGRRTFTWHSGGEAILTYQRRNVLGFSADFAEDVTKSNWSMEFTWFNDVNRSDAEQRDGLSTVDTFNLTISVDRPTFINFLNANRTFFFNSQWFFQYITNYEKGFTSNGPFNVLFTFAFFTGYFQDRLLPTMVTVYDFRSQSGGFLPSVVYRFTEAFSATIGASFFVGHRQRIDMPIRGFAPTTNRAGPSTYKNGNEQLLTNFKDRDEVYVRLRWTF
jgi:hypothetical protein